MELAVVQKGVLLFQKMGKTWFEDMLMKTVAVRSPYRVVYPAEVRSFAGHVPVKGSVTASVVLWEGTLKPSHDQTDLDLGSSSMRWPFLAGKASQLINSMRAHCDLASCYKPG